MSELWMREYESAVKNGIEPRGNLVDIYSAIKTEGKFPESNWRL